MLTLERRKEKIPQGGAKNRGLRLGGNERRQAAAADMFVELMWSVWEWHIG